MSRGPENTFISSVHRHLLPAVTAQKNHNEYVGGIADVWYDGRKADLWVEYKFIVIPRRDETVINLVEGKAPPLSNLQQEWLLKRHENGRRVAVVVGCKEGGVWFKPCNWTLPISAGDFRYWLKSRKEIAAEIQGIVHG